MYNYKYLRNMCEGFYCLSQINITTDLLKKPTAESEVTGALCWRTKIIRKKEKDSLFSFSFSCKNVSFIHDENSI